MVSRFAKNRRNRCVLIYKAVYLWQDLNIPVGHLIREPNIAFCNPLQLWGMSLKNDCRLSIAL